MFTYAKSLHLILENTERLQLGRVHSLVHSQDKLQRIQSQAVHDGNVRLYLRSLLRVEGRDGAHGESGNQKGEIHLERTRQEVHTLFAS